MRFLVAVLVGALLGLALSLLGASPGAITTFGLVGFTISQRGC